MSQARDPSAAVSKRSSRDTMLSIIAVFGPIAVYLTLRFAVALSDIWALTIGAAVAAAAMTCQAISRGRPNGIAILVMIELGISIVLVLTTHNPRILLYKPAVLLSVIGLYLSFTCIWGRPAAYETTLSAVSRRDPARGAAFERAYQTSSEMRFRLCVMTATWGIAFLLDAVVRVYFALTASVAEALIAPHVINAGLIAIAVGIAAVQFHAINRLV